MTQRERICRDLEHHPGSTWLEVTSRTGVPSPHRRCTGKESPKYWRLRTEKRGKLFVHFADRLDGEDVTVPFQEACASGASAQKADAEGILGDPIPGGNRHALPVEPDDPSLEAEARAVADRLGYTPSAMQEANR